jgi:hypothetical protein
MAKSRYQSRLGVGGVGVTHVAVLDKPRSTSAQNRRGRLALW